MSNIDSLLDDLDYMHGDELTEVVENAEISEVDELRKDQLAEIMGDIFTEDVLGNWDNMSMESKVDLINEYYKSAGDALGIGTKNVIVEDLQAQFGEGTMGYNNGDGNVHVDISRLQSSEQLPYLLITVTHEMRHQLQSEAISNPEKFPDIPDKVLDQWRYELDPINYISPEYDYEGYYNQEVEKDARNFGESVLERYIEYLI